MLRHGSQQLAIMHQLLLARSVVCRCPHLSLERCPRPTQLQGLCCNRSFGVLFSTCLRDGLLLLVLLVPVFFDFSQAWQVRRERPDGPWSAIPRAERLTEQKIEPVRLQCYTATLKCGWQHTIRTLVTMLVCSCHLTVTSQLRAVFVRQKTKKRTRQGMGLIVTSARDLGCGPRLVGHYPRVITKGLGSPI